MEKQRVIFFIDGFNLYHSIADLSTSEESKNHLKWLSLPLLCGQFVDNTKQEVIEIYYFSAYADWLADSVSRHKKTACVGGYVEARNAIGIGLYRRLFQYVADSSVGQ